MTSINQLTLFVNGLEEEKNANLDNLLKAFDSNDNATELGQLLCDQTDVLPLLQKYIETEKNTLTLAKSCQMIAELAKSEIVRNKIIECDIVASLLRLVKHIEVKDEEKLLVQVFRALGNICYDNEKAKIHIEKNGGVEDLIEVLKDENMITPSNSELINKLKVVSCGYLVNLMDNSENIQVKVLSCDIVSILENLLKHCEESHVDNLPEMVLLCIDSLLDTDNSKKEISDSNIPDILLKMMKNKKLTDSILEILSSLVDFDKVRLILAKADILDDIIDLIKNTDYDDDSLIKSAVDIIVGVLTEDESMERYFQNGQGKVVSVCISWLSSPITLLQMTGALSLGNFARNDTHCLKLVEMKIHVKLINLLTLDQNNWKLQHAILSTLRNLSIAEINKPILLQDGVLDKVTKLIHTDVYLVQFKLLATLRMLINGQADAAAKIGETQFIQRFIEFCKIPDDRVRGEANRLLASIIKHSHSSIVMQNFLKLGGLKYMVEMCNSEYAIMQMEALVVLSLIASLLLDESESEFIYLKIGAAVNEIFKSDSSEQLLCNSLTLVGILTRSDLVKMHLQHDGVIKFVNNLCSHGSELVKEKAELAKQKLQ